MSRHGQDVAEELDALGLDDMTLVGGSMGANTIWAYLDLHPAGRERRVRGVVAVVQTPKLTNTGPCEHAGAAIARTAHLREIR